VNLIWASLWLLLGLMVIVDSRFLSGQKKKA